MSTVPDEPVSRFSRRFPHFSVRGLLVLVLVIGIWMGSVVHLAHIQRDAVAAIERVGGRVSYDWEWSNGKSIPAGKPWAPRWLTDLIGVDYFGHVTAVTLSETGNDATIVHVGRLSLIETDFGLGHLKELTNLSALYLNHTQVTDAGLVHVEGLTSLNYLSLIDTQLTDAGLVHPLSTEGGT